MTGWMRRTWQVGKGRNIATEIKALMAGVQDTAVDAEIAEGTV